ncbi:hypothetical protein OG738_03695 [Amycolatopsis sp. NBC_01488]|uniref:hypothetical protein n=1 Tax=Amycolatopsis sp. NBC_01488 TaxID=2903563 RepID=UPI002E2C3E16|nr:hypothetical protein [Amycolatopsis sp. NBC_01488]
MSNTTTPSPPPGDLAVQLRRLSKLLEQVVKRLEETERMSALTFFIQDELCEHVSRLLDYAAKQREQARAEFLKSDTFANSTAHEEHRPS